MTLSYCGLYRTRTKKLTDAGFAVTARNSEGHMARIRKEVPMFKKVIAEAGIKLGARTRLRCHRGLQNPGSPGFFLERSLRSFAPSSFWTEASYALAD